MYNFFYALFFGIGFTFAIIGITYGATRLVDSVQNAVTRRNNRMQRLLTALERIEENTRNKASQG